MTKVIDDFLPDHVFQTMRDMVHSQMMEWQYEEFSSSAATSTDEDMMSSMIYQYGRKDMNKDSFWHIFLQTHNHHMPFAMPLRMKANMYFNRGRKVKHSAHCDMVQPDQARTPIPNVITSVFNFTDCNGSTNIMNPDGTEEVVESKANRIVLFPNQLHYGVTQDDTSVRVVLNTNVSTVIPDQMM